jgi:hypothetical protein
MGAEAIVSAGRFSRMGHESASLRPDARAEAAKDAGASGKFPARWRSTERPCRCHVW